MMVHEVHNAWLHAFAGGVIGGLCTFFCGWCSFTPSQSGATWDENQLAILALCSLVSVGLQSTTSFPRHNPMPGVWLFLLVGLAYAHHQRKQALHVD